MLFHDTAPVIQSYRYVLNDWERSVIINIYGNKWVAQTVAAVIKEIIKYMHKHERNSHLSDKHHSLAGFSITFHCLSDGIWKTSTVAIFSLDLSLFTDIY